MAVKYDPRSAEEPQEWYDMRNQIAEDHVESVATEGHCADEVRQARDGARRTKVLSNMVGQKASVYPHVEGAVACLLEAAGAIMMGGKERDAVARRLQRQGGIHDQALSATDTQVRVEESNVETPVQKRHSGIKRLRSTEYWLSVRLPLLHPANMIPRAHVSAQVVQQRRVMRETLEQSVELVR
jgi:hypothetical protein